jgi:hypothetical protein
MEPSLISPSAGPVLKAVRIESSGLTRSGLTVGSTSALPFVGFQYAAIWEYPTTPDANSGQERCLIRPEHKESPSLLFARAEPQMTGNAGP